MYEDVATPESSSVNKVVELGDILDQVLAGRIRSLDDQILFVLKERKETSWEIVLIIILQKIVTSNFGAFKVFGLA